MEAAALLGVLFVLGLLGSGVVALIVAISARSRAKDLEFRLETAVSRIDRQDEQLLELKRELRLVREGLDGGARPEPGAEARPEPEPAPAPEPAPSYAPPVIAVPPVIASHEERAPAPEPITVPPVVEPAAPLPPREVPREPEPAAPPPSAPPPIPPGFEALPPRRFDWESLVGVKLFSWVAGVALALGAVFFLQYSIVQGWLSPTVRCAIGLLVGTSLVLGCELKAARRYSITANALDGAGLFTLFATAFAAHTLWHLIGALPAFAFMALVAAVAVGLSIRRESIFIALLGLLGGFSTPALLSTGQDHPFGLFGYLLLLNAGLGWVAYEKSWPILAVLALAGTTFYQWAWVAKFLAPEKLPIALGIFLVFPLLSVALGARRGEGGDEPGAGAIFRATAASSAALPALFAFHLAAVPAYGHHFWHLFGFLLVLAAGLSAVAIARRLPILLAAAGVSTLLTFALWISLSYTHAAWPAILGIVSAFVLLHLAVPIAASRLGAPLAPPISRLVAVVPALLLFVFPVLVSIEPAAAPPLLLFGVLLVLMAVLAAFALVFEEGLVHFTSAFFVLAAEAVWSMNHLTRPRLLPALLLYGGFALFYLGVPLLARRLGKTLRPAGSGSVALLLSIGLLFFLAAGPLAEASLWGMALLLSVLNLGLIVEARSPGGARAALWGIALSWAVLLTWWNTAPIGALLVPALVVTAGFAVVVLGGTLGRGASPVAGGAHLALVGHLFLLFVASQANLSIPPWPLLGVLFVLTLALSVAALFTDRGSLHLAGLAATQVVLFVFVANARAAPWPRVGMLAAGFAALLGIVWLFLARRRGLQERLFAYAALAGLFLAEAVATLALSDSGAPDAGFLALFHLALVAALLLTAWKTELLGPAVLAVPFTAAALVAYRAAELATKSWSGELALALGIAVPFLLFPLLLGRRVGGKIEPHLAAVLATVPLFLFARGDLVRGGYGHVIGLLPVALALYLLVLVKQLLAGEDATPRNEGRLALVAGAALAFVTVAIPLQLDREWITLGWALEAAALAWLFGRIPHRGLFFFSSGLYAAVFVRLVFNRAVFSYHARGDAPVLNWYLYTYLVAAAAFFAGAWLFRTTADDLPASLPRLSAFLPAGGTVLLFLLLNIEIADYYSTGSELTFNFSSASLGQDLWYTVGWALFSIALLAAGIRLRSRVARVTALALLVVTILKCFGHDLLRLGGLYRVASFVGLAVSLALVAIAIQRFVLRPAREEEAGK